MVNFAIHEKKKSKIEWLTWFNNYKKVPTSVDSCTQILRK